MIIALACGSRLEASGGDAGSSDGNHGGDGDQDRDGAGLGDGGMAGNGCGVHATGCDAADPLEWAEWPMPNSPGDVEGGAPNLESYTDNLDGTITDNVTHLMWQKDSPAESFTWGCASEPGTAQEYCAALRLAGHHDWRLPKYIELISLLDYSSGETVSEADAGEEAGSIAINRKFFNGGAAVGSTFWTDTNAMFSPPLPGGITPWAVDFYAAGPGAYSASTRLGARCVR